jgi:hypothetical protein
VEDVMVRGKFKVQSIKSFQWSPTAKEITFGCEYDPSIPEDQKYSKATPQGSITMIVDNPPAAEYLALGKTFYVDFTAVEPA